MSQKPPVVVVEGFLKFKGNLILIRKNKPDWIRGKLNGVGGHIEDGETPIQAMIREFKEEAGIDFSAWRPFLVLQRKEPNGDPFVVHFFVGEFIGSKGPTIINLTDEKCMWYSPEYVRDNPTDVVDNLNWIIPLALDKNQYFGFLAEG